MFRGKESSNRIELSRLVHKFIEFWCFRLPAALGGVGGFGGGWVDGMGGGWRVPPHMYTCTHTHAHTCMRGKHGNFMQMAAPIGEIPGNSI